MLKLSRKRLAREIVRMIAERPDKQADIMRELAAYLIESKQTAQTDLLLSDISNELLKAHAHLNATVSTAFGLSDSLRQSIKTMLQHKTGARTVELYEQIEPQLLGGLKVRAAGLELDASIKRQLSKLAGGTK